MLRSAIPVLKVSSSKDAERFYEDKLGFTKQFEYRPDETRTDPCYMGLTRDNAYIHLSSFPGDSVAGCAVYVITDDVDTVYAEFTSRGVNVGLEPTDQSWSNREMYIDNPDGNSIRFVQEAQ